jgi:hypothetical protein
MTQKAVTVVEKVKIMTLWREKVTTRGIVDWPLRTIERVIKQF